MNHIFVLFTHIIHIRYSNFMIRRLNLVQWYAMCTSVSIRNIRKHFMEKLVKNSYDHFQIYAFSTQFGLDVAMIVKVLYVFWSKKEWNYANIMIVRSSQNFLIFNIFYQKFFLIFRLTNTLFNIFYNNIKVYSKKIRY